MYFEMWSAGAVLWFLGSTYLAVKDGLPLRRSCIVLVVLGAAVWLGTKVHSHVAAGFPLSAVVAEPLDALRRPGHRLPGGILLAAFVAPIVALIARANLWVIGDAATPFAALAIAIGRLGCLSAGCCFGVVSDLPWAMRFRAGTDAAWNHVSRELIRVGEPSLPVHPLQLYLALSALCVAGVTVWWRSHGRCSVGEVSLVFVCLMGFSMAGLEMLRESTLVAHVPLRLEIPLVGGLLAGASLLVRRTT